MKLTQPFSARKARKPHILSVLHLSVQEETLKPRVMKETNCWNRRSLDTKASVTLCQNAGVRDWLAGQPPIAAPYTWRALYSRFQDAMTTLAKQRFIEGRQSY